MDCSQLKVYSFGHSAGSGQESTVSCQTMAICWMARSDPADIFQVHGVGIYQAHASLCMLVYAINQSMSRTQNQVPEGSQ